jgi:two-component system nitrogen regulation sensor histidine kinase NtrY
MIFKHIGRGILLRVLLLFGMLNVGVYCLHYLFFPQILTVGLIVLAQVWELARYVTRGNAETARFIQSIANRDFSLQFTEQKTRSDLPQLHRAFNQLNRTFTQLHIEREAQFRLLQTMLQIIDTGILAYDETGEVLWINEAFKKALKLPHLKNIQALEKRNETLFAALKNLKPGPAELLKLNVNDEPVQMLISATAFKMQQQNLTLLAFKNVSSTVNQTETEAWQKLLRVMTHEIMNSVAPISSLADTMLRELQRNKPENDAANQPYPELLQDTEEVLSVIQHRSEGLLKFAQVYRNLSKVSELYRTTVYVSELFQAVSAFMKLEQEGIAFNIQDANHNLQLQADPHLLEQVLINLILNAQRAVQDCPNPTIVLRAGKRENGSIIIEVEDNGSGIPKELLDSIFIPFFTTHKSGSGIGLSLAKQIMTLHKGNIQVKSEIGKGTVFSLVF